MDAKEFLIDRNIIPKDKSDLQIGFDNGTTESLVELLEGYHQRKVNDVALDDVSIALSGFMDWLWGNHNILTNADNNKIALKKYLATL